MVRRRAGFQPAIFGDSLERRPHIWGFLHLLERGHDFLQTYRINKARGENSPLALFLVVFGHDLDFELTSMAALFALIDAGHRPPQANPVGHLYIFGKQIALSLNRPSLNMPIPARRTPPHTRG